jgi:hypothetical protein
MRVRSLVVLLALIVLVPAGSDQLREYAKRTWTSFVAMTDERSGLPADILTATAAAACRRRRRTSARTGGAPWPAARLGFISKRELVRRAFR